MMACRRLRPPQALLLSLLLLVPAALAAYSSRSAFVATTARWRSTTALAAYSSRSAFVATTRRWRSTTMHHLQQQQHRRPPHHPLLGPIPAAVATAPLQQQHLNHENRLSPLPPILRRRGGAFRLEPAVVKASITAVAELLISCGVGALATRKGVLDRTVISSLSKYVGLSTGFID